MQEKKRRHGCKITEEEREAAKNKIENKWPNRGKPRKRNSLRKKINLLNRSKNKRPKRKKNHFKNRRGEAVAKQ